MKRRKKLLPEKPCNCHNCIFSSGGDFQNEQKVCGKINPDPWGHFGKYESQGRPTRVKPKRKTASFRPFFGLGGSLNLPKFVIFGDLEHILTNRWDHGFLLL